jgi:hypothetical protein
MNTSPITTWEGAEAYFTFANEPLAIWVTLGLSAVAVLAAIIVGSLHEKECYVKVEKNGH